MDIKQTSQHLQRLGQPFDILINKEGVERQLYHDLEPTDVETLLNEVKATHNPDAIIIQERKRNGSVNVKTEKYPLTLNGIEVIPANTPPTPMANPLNVPADFKDYMISDLKEKNTKLEKKNDKLETENETLKKENFELEKENRYKDKEFELDKKGIEIEKSNGLSGVLETVSSNPALATIAATAIGRLMGIDVPAIGAIEQGGQMETSQSASAETVQAKVADNIKAWLIEQPEEVAQELFQLINQLAADVAKIPEVITFLNAQ